MSTRLSNIKKAIKYLNKNDCIAIPTETVYGLAANAYSDKAISKIYKLKKRPKNNPLIVHYYKLEDLEKDCHINSNFKKLYKKFCPGPISFVLKLKKNSSISKNVTNNKNTIAVRFPKHPITRNLLKKLKFPLAAPSANISKSVSPVTKGDVIDEFGNRIKFMLDGGRTKIGLESTIISLVSKPTILRLGGIERNRLNKILDTKIIMNNSPSKILSPGQYKLHYSPGIPVRLNVKKAKIDEAFLLISKRKNKSKNFFYLSKNKNLKEIAKKLYQTLRKVKKLGYKSIAVERIPKKELGETINDRLQRASNY